MVVAFLHLLDSHTLLNEGEDLVRWRWKKNWEFDMLSYYNALRGSTIVSLPWKGVQGFEGSLESFFFFFWMEALGKILTCDHLRRRGYTIVNWCCVCWCMRGQQVTFFFIVRGHISCGALFLDLLGSPGSYKREQQISCLGGGTGWENIPQIFGIWLCCV